MCQLSTLFHNGNWRQPVSASAHLPINIIPETEVTQNTQPIQFAFPTYRHLATGFSHSGSCVYFVLKSNHLKCLFSRFRYQNHEKLWKDQVKKNKTLPSDGSSRAPGKSTLLFKFSEARRNKREIRKGRWLYFEQHANRLG